jgi:hypothetical protein
MTRWHNVSLEAKRQVPGFKPNTQRRVPSDRRQIVTWPAGGGTGIASSNGTNSSATTNFARAVPVKSATDPAIMGKHGRSNNKRRYQQ